VKKSKSTFLMYEMLFISLLAPLPGSRNTLLRFKKQHKFHNLDVQVLEIICIFYINMESLMSLLLNI
jgi:hypothetical protein